MTLYALTSSGNAVPAEIRAQSMLTSPGNTSANSLDVAAAEDKSVPNTGANKQGGEAVRFQGVVAMQPNSEERTLAPGKVVPLVESAGVVVNLAASNMKQPTLAPASAIVAQTLLDAGLTITGDIESSVGVVLRADVHGNVKATSGSSIRLLPECTVKGNVTGSAVLVEGTVNGDVNAHGGRVEISETSQIHGNVAYAEIIMKGGKHQLTMEHAPDPVAQPVDA